MTADVVLDLHTPALTRAHPHIPTHIPYLHTSKAESQGHQHLRVQNTWRKSLRLCSFQVCPLPSRPLEPEEHHLPATRDLLIPRV